MNRKEKIEDITLREVQEICFNYCPLSPLQIGIMKESIQPLIKQIETDGRPLCNWKSETYRQTFIALSKAVEDLEVAEDFSGLIYRSETFPALRLFILCTVLEEALYFLYDEAFGNVARTFQKEEDRAAQRNLNEMATAIVKITAEYRELRKPCAQILDRFQTAKDIERLRNSGRQYYALLVPNTIEKPKK